MRYLIAWIALPLLVVAASWGVGLLVEQLTRLRLPQRDRGDGRLRRFVRRAGAPVPARARARHGARRLLVVLAVTGVVLARDRLAELAARLRGRVTAMLAVYGLYMAPIVLSGQTTFAGYTLLGDTSVHFSLIDYISDHGARARHAGAVLVLERDGRPDQDRLPARSPLRARQRALAARCRGVATLPAVSGDHDRARGATRDADPRGACGCRGSSPQPAR